jgi:hypothetical protein
LLHHLPRLFQSFGDLCKPARARDRSSLIRHSNHSHPPAQFKSTLPRLINFALGQLRSGAEFV